MMKRVLITIVVIYICIVCPYNLHAQTSLKYIKDLTTKTEKSFSSPVFTNDGNFVLAGGYDGSLNKWSLKSEFPVKQKELSDKAIYAISITANGKYILAGGLSGTLYLCDAESFEVIKTAEGFNNIQKISTAPNSTIAYIQTNGKCKLVNIKDLSVIGENGYSLAFDAWFSNDSRLLYHATRRTEIGITNTATAETQKDFSLKKEIYNIVVTSDERIIIAGVQEGYGETTILKIIDLQNGEIKNLVENTKSGDYGTPLCLVPNTDKIMYNCYDGIFTLDVKTREIKKISGDFDAMEMKISPSGKHAVALARRENGIRLMEIK